MEDEHCFNRVLKIDFTCPPHNRILSALSPLETNKTEVLSCKVKLDGNLGRMLSASTAKFAMQDFLEFPSALENQSLLKCQ